MAEVWKEVRDFRTFAIESLNVSEEDWVDEASGRKWHGMVMELPVQKGDEINQNRRKYPWSEVLKPALEDYSTEQVDTRFAYLHADHNDPRHDDPTIRKIHNDRTAALMVKLDCREDDKTGIGKIRVLGTDAGKCIREMWSAGGNIGVSSVSKIVAEQATDDKGETIEVAKKMKILGFDLVINPSVKEAVPTQVSFERKENKMKTPEELEAEKKAEEKAAADAKAEVARKAAEAKKKTDDDMEDDEYDEDGKPIKKKKVKKIKSAKELREMYPELVGEIEGEAITSLRAALRTIAEVLAETGIVQKQEDESAEEAIDGLKEQNTHLQSRLDDMDRESKLRDILSGFTAEEQENLSSMLEDIPTDSLADRAAPIIELLKEKNVAVEAAKTVTEKKDDKDDPVVVKTTETSKTQPKGTTVAAEQSDFQNRVGSLAFD